MELVKINHIKDVEQALIEVYLSGYKGLEQYSYHKRKDVKSYLRWLFRCDPNGFFVAKEEEKIVGFIACCRKWYDAQKGKTGEIHEFVVKRDYQGKGIGDALLKKALDYLSQYQDKATLWVGEDNLKAIEFYQKRGFKRAGGIGRWIRMWRPISR